jgi:hypothetical protein
MSTGWVIALVVVLVVIAAAWMLLKSRRGKDAETAAPPPVFDDVEAVESAPLVPPPGCVVIAPRATVPQSTAPAPPVVVAPPAAKPVAPAEPPAPDSITVIMARPRPPAPVVERVLALEDVDAAEWEAAQPLTLSAVQSAAVASAMAATTPMHAGESALHAVRFEAGSAIRIARGELEAIRAIAAAGAASTERKERWLDSAAATTLASTALAALAGERWLDALGDEMRDLKASVAALPVKLAAQCDGRLKPLVQDLSRFAREARDNYMSVVGKFAFRERVGEGCERASHLWHELVASTDALRQQLEQVGLTPRFGEAQIERCLALWRELQSQERLQEIAARLLAGMYTLRLALGDAAPMAGVDPLVSASAALQAGLAQDQELTLRLTEREKDAQGDPYVGKAEFAANRAALRKLLDKPAAEAMALAMQRLAAAAATGPLDAGAGAPSRLLVLSPPGERMGLLRWSSAPRSG